MQRITMSRVLAWWSFLTAAGWLAGFALAYRLPQDEIDVSTNLGFLLLASLCVVGIVSLFLLFLFLFFGAILKKNPSPDSHEV